MFILKKGNQPGVYVPLRALFLVKRALTSLPSILIIKGEMNDAFGRSCDYL